MNVNIRCQLERSVEYGCYVMEYYVQIISGNFCRNLQTEEPVCTEGALLADALEYELFAQYYLCLVHPFQN